jgi:hypothetical protein
MEPVQSSLKHTLAALGLFVVLSLVLTYPLPLHLADAVEDRQDALLNVWITAWDGHQLLSDPLHLFDANIFWTYPRTLAYSELLLGNALLALPLTAITGNPVLGYNVALLLSFVLSALGAYLLVLALTRSPGAGIIAGIIFAFSSYRMTNLAQAQLLITQWLPFALLSLYQLLRRPRLRHVVTCILFFCLQALSSFYYGILLALAGVGLVAVSLVLRPSFFVTRHRSWVVHLLAAVVCCALVILPFALPYFQVQRELGFERSLADSEPFSASLRQYLMVPPRSVVHGQWLPSDDTPIAGGYPVDALFPGLVTLALALWGLIRGQGRIRWYFFLLFSVSAILSLGPRLYLAPGQPAGLEANLPYAWLYALLPGFKALRAPVRFDALVSLSLAVLAGYGLADLIDRTKRIIDGRVGRKLSGLLVGCCLLLVILDLMVWPAARAEQVPVGADVPPVYRWLADQPAGPILELPMAFTPAGPRLDYQYLSTYHWHATPDGYSGFIPPKHGQIVYEMERFPSERSTSLLQVLGVRQVVIHTDRRPELGAPLARAEDLSPLESFGADEVYAVQPRSFEPDDLAVRLHLSARAVAGAPYTAYVIATNSGSRSYAVRPTDQIQATVTWATGESMVTSSVVAGVPLVTSPDGGAAVIPLALTAPAEPGRYQVRIGEEDGPLGTWSGAGTIEVGDQGDDAFPVPAQLVAWNMPPTIRPGEPLPVSLTWRALGKIDAYYSIYVKLLDAERNAIAGWDGQPRSGQAPTLLWEPGEIIDDRVDLLVPGDASAGDYTLEAGMYRAEDLARCLTLNGEGMPLDRILLGAVHIEP